MKKIVDQIKLTLIIIIDISVIITVMQKMTCMHIPTNYTARIRNATIK